MKTDDSQLSDLTKFAEESLNNLTKTLTDVGSNVMKTLKESKITESIGSGVESVRATLADPNLQMNIRDSVQSGT